MASYWKTNQAYDDPGFDEDYFNPIYSGTGTGGVNLNGPKNELNDWQKAVNITAEKLGKEPVYAISVVATKVIPAVAPSSIMVSTIVPKPVIVSLQGNDVQTVSYTTIPGLASPAPMSILGIGEIVGVLMIKYGGMVVGELALAASEGLMGRVGKRLDNRLQMRYRTGRGYGRGRHKRLRGESAKATDSSDPYEEPGTSKWYDPFSWIT